MPGEFPEVEDWPSPTKVNRKPREDYLEIERKLRSQPPNKKRLVAAGLDKIRAGNLRAWLNDRQGITARTTGRESELQKYTEQLKELGYDLTQLVDPHNHIVLARFSDADQAQSQEAL